MQNKQDVNFLFESITPLLIPQQPSLSEQSMLQPEEGPKREHRGGVHVQTILLESTTAHSPYPSNFYTNLPKPPQPHPMPRGSSARTGKYRYQGICQHHNSLETVHQRPKQSSFHLRCESNVGTPCRIDVKQRKGPYSRRPTTLNYW